MTDSHSYTFIKKWKIFKKKLHDVDYIKFTQSVYHWIAFVFHCIRRKGSFQYSYSYTLVQTAHHSLFTNFVSHNFQQSTCVVWSFAPLYITFSWLLNECSSLTETNDCCSVFLHSHVCAYAPLPPNCFCPFTNDQFAA